MSSSSQPVQTVVIDNASTKGDIGAVCSEFENVTLLRSPENIGFGRANNMGIKWALENTGCEYVFLLNNDAYINKDTIAILQRYMDDNTHIDGCSSRIVYADTPDILWYGGGELNWKRGGCRVWDYLQKFNGDLTPVEVTFITGCSMMLRTGIIKKTGGFDPRFFMYAEDIELCARIIQNGGRLAYVPSAIVWHDVHSSIKGHGDSFRTYDTIDNDFLIFFLENGLNNFIFILNKYARGIDRIIGNTYLIAKWGRNAFRYLLKGRPIASLVIIKAFLGTSRPKRGPFVDEIQSDKSPNNGTR